jgi:nitroreductase
MRNQFEEALHFRHSCKLFDTAKKITEEDLHFILDAGRLAPSSFGMEGWEFRVVQDGTLKEQLKPLCWDQPQITTCSDLVVLLSRKNMRSTNPYVVEQFRPRGEHFERYLQVYHDFVDPRSDEEINCWSGKQVYIASGFIMMAAASIEIDSCPIEGFDKEKVEALLGIDTENFEIQHLIALGYRVNEQPPRHRRPFEDVVRFL